MKTYSEKLKDPRWQKKRLQILERDGWACQICFDISETLHVHHREYRRGAEPWDYQDHSLVTLCASCHELESFSYNSVVERLGNVIKRYGGYSHQVDRIAEAFMRVTNKNGTPVLLSEPDFSEIEQAIFNVCMSRAKK